MEHAHSGQNKKVTTDDLIEALTTANFAAGGRLEQEVFRDSLRALIRLAKAEKLLELKRDVALSVGLDPKRLPTTPPTRN